MTTRSQGIRNGWSGPRPREAPPRKLMQKATVADTTLSCDERELGEEAKKRSKERMTTLTDAR
ncbi:uncharacterized protein PgNI_05059 [Pyricularia grisea]|uniref:Uncharacterized protein n=1 Tax=Pyricularia grisea TaxID=148305 RepID=A0A6P8BE97_PYRGI|nr:uncharacterized protein PgNI_05059 [Pyricularia grisea]TLD14022.1 hypothetical protein PgNI_05059 [Pyricularia grisea]